MTFAQIKATTKHETRVVVKRGLPILLSILVLFLLTAFGGQQQALPEPTVISGSGDITAVVEEYRQLFGGQNNGGEPGSGANGFREINWDTLPDEEAAPN